jgi:PPOX class probable F420-dependent enzyme
VRTFLDLGNEAYVLLTTFRTNGERVATPVWVARDGETLIVTTPTASGKVKRLRNNVLIEIQPCDRRGNPTVGGETMAGIARIIEDEPEVSRCEKLVRRKYNAEYAVFSVFERIAAKGKATPRVILRITAG